MKIRDLLNEINALDDQIQEGDYFDIELDNIVLETSVIGVIHDGILIEVDDVALAYLKTEEINEGLRNTLGKLALATTIGLGSGGASAGGVTLGGGGHTGDAQVRINQQTTAQKAEPAASQASAPKFRPMPNDKPVSSGFSKEYLEKVVRGEHPRPLISVEKAQELLKLMNEAEYQGRKVPLGKPMAGDVKKSKVYVKGPSGRVVKVNFGDKKMKIKKSNPNRRKSFRARHNCENPGPRWKARYWSCRAW